MQIDVDRFREVFFEEAADHLADMEAALLRLEETPQDQELLHRIFRCAHSIKGASSTFGFSDIARFTHVLESLLDRMRDGEICHTTQLTDLLLRSADTLRGLVAAARNGQESPAEVESVLGELEHALAQGPPTPVQPSASSPSASVYRVVFVPGRDVLRQGMDPLLLLRNLCALGEVSEVQADLSHLPALPDLDPESCYLSWSVRLRTDKTSAEIKDVFSFVEDSSQVIVEALAVQEATFNRLGPKAHGQEAISKMSSSGLQPPAAEAAGRSGNLESSSIRVSTAKVDKLINLVGELVITQSMITQVINNFSPDKLHQLQEAATAMGRNTRELQERVMAVRLLPIGHVFNRFPRLVRDLATAFNKKVSLQVMGEETELDKGVIERIGDPLTHLIRNAVDHGIEFPEERRAAGKPEQGTIRLHAFYQGGNVIIEVADDGRGLDTERIRQKGIAQGLINAEDVCSTEQIHALIFQPGFSTATAVNDVSGRGVGMDVVKKNVEALNGSVSVFSEPGRGTCLRIKLPLTLSILDGLSLKVGEEIYILPLTTIVESIQPRTEHLKRVLGQREVVEVRGEFLPLLRLYRLFDIPARVTDPSQGLVVIVENEGNKLGLLVDELLGQQQVVVKNLETNFRKVEGVMGATIMGDGRVALILDVQGLARLAERMWRVEDFHPKLPNLARGEVHAAEAAA
jgi:two-component system chemotaxis sensor kinase CheA